ncbi:kinase-like domain-containing protein [Xylaria venustula]|nr:kinase-like domain-containing protein [Xylaria venustula]
MDDSKIQRPILTSLQDLTILEALDPETDEVKYVTFYHITSEDDLYFGQLYKQKKDISVADYSLALEHVKDEEIYPPVPEDTRLKIAPNHWEDTTAFIKRPGLNCYETMKGSDYIPKEVLHETLIMEQISMTPHPNIITYLGCHVKRGRITAIVLEHLNQTLTQFSWTPAFHQLDHEAFIKAVESAVYHIHSLGLAHNDINPDNIMIRDGMPVLIDFGSCQPFGMNLQSLGTDGWYEEEFFTSEAKHDEYSLKKLKQWLQKPE